MLKHAGLILMVAVGAWSDPAVAQERRPVNKADINVWDGDTFKTKKDGRICLRTCDAPEYLWPQREAAIRATERLIGLIERARSTDLVCSWEPPCRDGFGRLICDLVLDGKDACDTLITEGLATKQKRMRACSRDWPSSARIDLIGIKSPSPSK